MWELSDQGRIFEKWNNAYRTLCLCMASRDSQSARGCDQSVHTAWASVQDGPRIESPDILSHKDSLILCFNLGYLLYSLSYLIACSPSVLNLVVAAGVCKEFSILGGGEVSLVSVVQPVGVARDVIRKSGELQCDALYHNITSSNAYNALHEKQRQ